MFFYKIVCTFFLVGSLAFVQAQEVSTKISAKSAEEISTAREKEAQGDKRQASHYLNESATREWETKNYKDAISLFKKSLQLNEEIGNTNGVYGISNNLGMIYNDLGDFETATSYFLKNLEGRRAGKDKVSLISALVNISVVLNNLKRFKQAVAYLEESANLAKELGDLTQLRSCYGMLAETFEKMGDTKQMLHYFELYRTFHEKVQGDRERTKQFELDKANLTAENLELIKKNQELELQTKSKEIRQKEATITNQKNVQMKLLGNLDKAQLIMKYMQKDSIANVNEAKFQKLKRQEEQEMFEAQRQRSRLIQLSLIIGLSLLGLLMFFLFLRYREKKKTNQQLTQQKEEIQSINEELKITLDTVKEYNEVIEHKNKHIMASIQYAQRIQQAILPIDENVKAHLPESFILFKPRDVVSGDFYYFHEQAGKVLLAAIDCTGHGVPGAFMTMIGYEILNEIIINRQIVYPDLVLNDLHKGINKALKQAETNNQDGMDLSFITIDKTQKMLYFAGAKNPAIYIQNGELQELKADKFPIGGGTNFYGEERIFARKEIGLNTPTSIFLFSDGYQDQFGGAENKKFKIAQMRKMFLENYHKTPQTQHEIYANTIDTWIETGNESQTDDILLIGVQIS